MMIELNEIEARVLGALVEKSLTTPESYPLTLNSLVSACNQKTSRDPVMSLEEPVVAQALHSLIERNLAGRLHEPGSRVPKFMHHAEILLDGADAKSIATICVLLLRGAQTAGEIKTRTDRLCEFESSAEVESLLQDMSLKTEAWVAKLPRQAGQKESRWRQLFTSGAEPVPAAPAPVVAVSSSPKVPAVDRVAELEKRVARLEELLKVSAPNDPS